MSSREIYYESKNRLIERIHSNLNAIGQIHKQIVKGSKSPEVSAFLVVN